MDKLKPKEKEPEVRVIYKHTWPAVKGVISGKRYSNSPISIEMRVMNGKVKDVIINGAPFILDLKKNEIRRPDVKASGVDNGKD